MRTIVIAVLVLVLLPTLPLWAQTGSPVLFYSDLDSGPATGGEGGSDGAFVCVFGENFGAMKGSSKLSIGGTEVAAYKVWSDPGLPYLPPHYAKICGQVSHSTASGLQDISLSVGTETA